jgi:hypothetical protein
VLKGAVFSGNGIINGNVHNAGLVRIPIVNLPVVTGGYVQVTPEPVMVAPGTVVNFAGGGDGGGLIIGGGGTPVTPVYMIQTPAVQTHGTFAVDASLEVTGTYTQTETCSLRMFVGGNDAASFGPSKSGGTYSQLFVHKAVSLDGSLQIVLQPELFNRFDYDPKLGDTFDFVISDESITLAPTLNFDTFVTAAGASMLTGLTLAAFDSGISSDPDSVTASSSICSTSRWSMAGRFCGEPW